MVEFQLPGPPVPAEEQEEEEEAVPAVVPAEVVREVVRAAGGDDCRGVSER